MTRLLGEGEWCFGLLPRDDRGRSVRGLADIEVLARRATGLEQEAREALVRPLRNEDRLRLLGAVLLVLLLGTVEDWTRFDVAGGAGLAIHLAVALVLVWPVLLLLNRRWFGLQRRAALAVDACPACGRSMVKVAPGQGGCRVCRRCDAAWKADSGDGGTDA